MTWALHVSNFSKSTHINFSTLFLFLKFLPKKRMLFHFHLSFKFVILEYLSSMNTWKNIFPCHQIFYPMCQIILFKYSINISRIFPKKLFMPTCSCSPNSIPSPSMNMNSMKCHHLQKCTPKCFICLDQRCVHYMFF